MLEVPIGSNYNNSMLSVKQKFVIELRNGTNKIPMKDFCVRKAQDLVFNKNRKLMVLFDFEMIEMQIEDMLYKYWRRRKHLQPNHRWVCIEGDLNSEWFYKHSGYVNN